MSNPNIKPEIKEKKQITNAVANHELRKFWLLKITSVFNWLIFFSLLLTISITSTTKLYSFLHVRAVADDGILGDAILKVYLILIVVLVLIAASLFVLISFNNKWVVLMKEYAFISIVLSIISLNFYGLYFLIKEIMVAKKQNEQEIGISFWVKFKRQVGIKKWVTFDYVLVALFCGLTITFAYIEENLLPSMPFGGGIGLKYIPLIMISFTTCFLGGWLTGFVSALMSLLFIPASHILSPWSYLLDYFLPMTTPALIAFLPFKVSNDKSIFTYINYFLHCFIILSLIYIWQVLSGILFWGQQPGTRIWEGYTIITYSLIYNFIPIFIFTYPILQAIIPILYRSLGNYYLKRYHQG